MAGGVRPALRNPSFRLLIGGELVSNFGDGVYLVALPWYVLSQHGGAFLLGAVLTAYGVPRTALLVIGGHASDRYGPWIVMLAANCARGIAVAVLTVTAAAGSAHGLLLIVIAVMLGAGEGIFIPASETIVPALLPASELQAGNALSAGVTQFSQMAGPPLGGVIVALIGPVTGFGIDAATFIISALTLIGIRSNKPRRPPLTSQSNTPGPDETLATVRGLLAGQPMLRLILITDALINLGSAGMSRIALPALVRGPFHSGAISYGVLSAAIGAGLLIGTLTGSSLPTAHRPFLTATVALLPTAPLIAAIPYAGGWIPAAALLTLAFVLIAVGNLLLITGLQLWAPPQLLGRLTGLLMLASVGMMPLSVLAAGIVINLTSQNAYFPLDAATILIATTIQLSSPTWRRFDPTQPAGTRSSTSDQR